MINTRASLIKLFLHGIHKNNKKMLKLEVFIGTGQPEDQKQTNLCGWVGFFHWWVGSGSEMKNQMVGSGLTIEEHREPNRTNPMGNQTRIEIHIIYHLKYA